MLSEIATVGSKRLTGVRFRIPAISCHSNCNNPTFGRNCCNKPTSREDAAVSGRTSIGADRPRGVWFGVSEKAVAGKSDSTPIVLGSGGQTIFQKPVTIFWLFIDRLG